MNLDYKRIDEKTFFSYREDKMKLVKYYGYTYISEAIVEMYKWHRNLATVGKLMGVTYITIRHHLLNWGVEIVRGRGRIKAS